MSSDPLGIVTLIRLILFFIVLASISSFSKAVWEQKWDEAWGLAFLMFLGVLGDLVFKHGFHQWTDFFAELGFYLLLGLGYFTLLYAIVLVRKRKWRRVALLPLLAAVGLLIYLGRYGSSGFQRFPVMWQIRNSDLGSVCAEGKGLYPYGSQSDGKSFTVVVFSSDGQLEISSSLALPKDWSPATTTDVRYVLCRTSYRIDAGSCSYYGGGHRNLVQYVFDLELREAGTGSTIARTQIYGEEPDCPSEITGTYSGTISGHPVDFREVRGWLLRVQKELSP